MKKLITYALIALITVSCSKDDVILENKTANKLGTLTFTYKGETKVFEGYNRTDGTVTPDINKPTFNWAFFDQNNRYSIIFNMGYFNNSLFDPNTYVIQLIKTDTNQQIFFANSNKIIDLKNIKITITYKDENYVSGNFESDLVKGSFEKIKK